MTKVHKFIITGSILLMIILSVFGATHGAGVRSFFEILACIAVILGILNEDKIIDFEVNLSKKFVTWLKNIGG